MFLKKILSCGFALFFLSNPLLATNHADEMIIGCRPWDDNMKEFKGLSTAHFVDFMKLNAPEELPSNFYHLDLNDQDICSAGRFSDFTTDNVGKYKTILIDWATYQHIRRKSAWADFAHLLQSGGQIYVPVTRINFKSGQPLSREAAEELICDQKLTEIFTQIDILNYDVISQDVMLTDFLFRPTLESGRLESYVEMKAVVILASVRGSEK